MILENPFYILGATTRDNRQKIVELAEDKSFELDEDLCQKARSDLTMPRNRLLAEINWFLGVSPRKINSLIEQINNIDKSIIYTDGLSELSKINLLDTVLSIDKFHFSTIETKKIILELINSFDNLEINHILRDINEDRAISQFPEVNDYEYVKNEVNEKQKQSVKKIIKRLNKLETLELIKIMTNIVDEKTANGTIQATSMIDDLVDDYKLHTQSFLESESEKIELLVNKISELASNGEDEIAYLIDKLIQMTKKWDDVAQPIQLSSKSRGLDDQLSIRVAKTIRSLSIELTNDYGYIELSQKISESLKDIFAELPEVLEQVKEDINALDDLLVHVQNNKKKQEREERQFLESMKYEAEIGIVLKDKIVISADKITWKNKSYSLNDINRITWGATSNSINGIPTGTDYVISFGDKKNTSKLETRRRKVYEEVIDRLWKTAGVNILTSMLKDFKNSQGLTLGKVTIWDDGVTLIKTGWFSGDEKKKFGWGSIQIYSSNGNFVIEAQNDKKFRVELSYQQTYNIHFLEQAIRLMFKNQNARKLSDLLSA